MLCIKVTIQITFFYLILALMQASILAAESTNSNEGSRTVVKSCPALSQEETTNTEMVVKVLNDNKPYAGLAFIESLNFSSPQLELLKANSMRLTGKLEQAKVIYASLIDTCVSAYAYQGLGWVNNMSNNNAESLNAMKMAAKLLPINSSIRSDYGFALMQSGEYGGAMNEYITAIELDDSNKRAKYNLIYLLYKNNQKEKAEQFAKIYKVSAFELEKINSDLHIKETVSAKENTNLVADKLSESQNESRVQCISSSGVCSGILSTKLEGYTYE